jgi:hypothetical protein
MSNGNDIDLIKKLTESYRQVRFGRGVVGKTGHAMIAVIALWIMIAWRWSGNLWADGGLAIVGIAATAAFIWWVRSTQQFAEKNPAQALLEGAELLEYQKFEAQAKGMPSLGSSPLIQGSLAPPDRHE